MKRRNLIGVVVILVFLVVAIFSLVKTDIEYADFNKSREKMGKKVQVKGQWVREKGSDYNVPKNEFTFFMVDENQQEMKVIFKGSKPNNFEIASHVIATGKTDNNIFIASDILTKCPSKYDGQKYDPNK